MYSSGKRESMNMSNMMVMQDIKRITSNEISGKKPTFKKSGRDMKQGSRLDINSSKREHNKKLKKKKRYKSHFKQKDFQSINRYV